MWDMGKSQNQPQKYEIGYSQFMEQLELGNVISVTLKALHLTGELKKDTSIYIDQYKTTRPVTFFKTYLPSFQGEELIKELKDKGVMINVESTESMSPFWQVVVGIIPWVLIIGVWILIMRGAQKVQGGPGGLFSFGSSKAKLKDVKKPSITFNDVAGMENVKKDLRETIEFLKDPARFSVLGAKVPRGILLFGAPGTGKTLLARAVAGEANVPFYSISASEFIEMFVGVGASRVRDMFLKARETQPSIIFIDEIDSIGRTRGAGLGSGHDEREQTLNQLLSELDGFESHEEIIVIAATNRPDVLDPALLRPGRFDRHIVIDRPGWKDRKAILEVHARGKKISSAINFEELAKGTPGMTGADLENLANEAALVATKENKTEIDKQDFEEARDKIFMGAVREETISDIEKKITAYHEAGHALTAHELPGTDPLYKVSIIPRGMAMGVTMQLPEEDRHFYPKKYLMNKLCVALAGRAAEKIIFDDVSTGAESDLKSASSLAEKMVAQWGMSDEVGPLSLGRGEEHPFLGRELSLPKRYSDEMAWLMDKEIQKLIIEAEDRAESILKDKRDILDRLAEELLKEEILEKADIDRIIDGS
ncbi:MAG TPA: ATP-dependent metallopeptidase FtsH/Yme1/Tma family protein [Nitrospirae bacterium]|nr:ATP-dependent metallopeptidase FtsH/Yme1/Tma family protein [Nitrospirota bacterium]HDZ84847.1 ATP-dependent metallopeptidase FtsH/Yme1/Tma family protein [Nitrospirota bacterium]